VSQETYQILSLLIGAGIFALLGWMLRRSGELMIHVGEYKEKIATIDKELSSLGHLVQQMTTILGHIQGRFEERDKGGKDS
jgi:hypothetical protein